MNHIKSLAPAVYILGAGPGDPDLLTVKADKILATADVIPVSYTHLTLPTNC